MKPGQRIAQNGVIYLPNYTMKSCQCTPDSPSVGRCFYSCCLKLVEKTLCPPYLAGRVSEIGLPFPC